MTAATDFSRPALATRLQAAFGAFLAPERLRPSGNDDVSDDHRPEATAGSLTDPLALPPDWHSPDWQRGGDLLSLSFLPFER